MMCDKTIGEIANGVDNTNMKIQATMVHPLLNNNNNGATDCETAEEAVTTDSEEYLSEPLRYRQVQYSSTTEDSQVTLVNSSMQGNETFYSCDNFSLNNIEVPIVGYEIMEERARFTVYKLRIENKASGDCWYVFRRYTDFVRLCNRLKRSYPQIVQHLPRKRWLGNNFDPEFLEERVNGLQTLVNAILAEPELLVSPQIQDFFCFNEPPIYSETNEESRAIFEALDETINELKQQLREKETLIDTLQDSLHTKTIENDNLKKIIRNSTMNCQKCQKDYENISKILK